MGFLHFWHTHPFNAPRFEKDKLSRDELSQAREIIRTYRSKGWPAYKIKTRLQKELGVNEFRASLIFDTETKRDDVVATRQLGKDVGFSEYKVILAPSACQKCVRFTHNGDRLFSQGEVQKSGWNAFIPHHPGCRCIVVPWS